MRDEKPKTVYRIDYRPPDFWIDQTDLSVDLGEEVTRVRARLVMRRNPSVEGDPPPLVLDGHGLALRHVALDGRTLEGTEYVVTERSLTVHQVPEQFVLETEIDIRPQDNLALSGLYKSGRNFCTQCEAMGFRRITYYLDRPDVMARFSTTIEADQARYPVLLSNGNCVAREALPDGRHRVVWKDPFPKPCYLFALVAGDLRCKRGNFVTRSGRRVDLEIWVEPENIDRCDHALASLKKAMRWDEETFGREYDLDIYMIVAVNDFNMGAMENKGLNIFNSKYVLAKPQTATDADYEGIEGVIAHEYFHNWTGNRITCRDWFQLTLKEGLTVFRDQQFTADMTSSAVKRIDDVRGLRLAQFPEDEGPMAHPIRPESYISMDNFYTSTVYQKGAEVIRMFHTLLGEKSFRAGMDLYFERHDGQAVTCDDFRDALADANGVDLDAFARWYAQAGTPILQVGATYNEATKSYRLTLDQFPPANSGGTPSEPLPIPVAVGLLGPDGTDVPLALAGEDPLSAPSSRVLLLRVAQQTFDFTGIEPEVGQAIVPSILRNFSAPVKLRMQRSREDLAFLAMHDSDAVSRWDAGQELASQLLLENVDAHSRGETLRLDPLFAEAFGRILVDPSLDGSLKALALSLPAEKLLAQEMPVIDVEGLHFAREFALRELARAHEKELRRQVDRLRAKGPYRKGQKQIQRRRLRHALLGYLASLGDAATLDVLLEQYRRADNMTDAEAALRLLVDAEGMAREEVLEDFYAKWHSDPLVLDKWFQVQALAKGSQTLDRVLVLSKHPDFSLKNPNRVRALIGAFCSGNQVRFHGADGRGYQFLGDTVLALDEMNPQMASRMVSTLNAWKRFDSARQELMLAQLERIASRPKLSNDVREIVERALRK